MDCNIIQILLRLTRQLSPGGEALLGSLRQRGAGCRQRHFCTSRAVCIPLGVRWRSSAKRRQLTSRHAVLASTRLLGEGDLDLAAFGTDLLCLAEVLHDTCALRGP